MNKRVKYYPTNDFACGMHLDKIETMFSFGSEPRIAGINDAIELYNISLYFKNQIILKKWSEEECRKYHDYAETFMPSVYKYFNSIQDNNIFSIVCAVDIDYYNDFWSLFELCKLYDRISPGVFGTLLQPNKIPIWNMLKQKNTVQKYGEVIREFLLTFNHAARIILSTQREDKTGQKTYLPDCLSTTDIDGILLKYVNGENPNPNHLQEIMETKLKVDPKTKLAAKRKYDSIIENHFAQNSGICIETNVGFAPNQKKVKALKNDGFKTSLRYDSTWIIENLDYPTLLNNFIYLFEFSDMQMRLIHVSKPTEMGIFERCLFSGGHERYQTGGAFKQKEVIALLQIHGYYDILKENNIQLELIIEWFFNDYLPSEFNITPFRISMPSEGTNYAEKCTLIVAAIESAVKQFSLVVQNGEIDFELLQLTSAGMKYNDIPSFITNKYAYGQGTNFNIATHLLFSDQSMLLYLERIKHRYDTFAALLLDENEKVFISDYNKSGQSNIQWLVNQGFLQICEDKAISIQDKEEIAVLADLYENEVINIRHLHPALIIKIESLHTRKYIRYGRSLLSNPEISLFNYYLNRAEFKNGLDLRNKYAHGVQQTSENAEEHKENYYILLRLSVLLIIKINDEFCLREPLQKEGNEKNLQEMVGESHL